nr:hypothetical protein GCM10020093_052110 [Planobispora longispora]
MHGNITDTDVTDLDVGDIDVADIQVGYVVPMTFVGRQEQLGALKEWWGSRTRGPPLSGAGDAWVRRPFFKSSRQTGEWSSTPEEIAHPAAN